MTEVLHTLKDDEALSDTQSVTINRLIAELRRSTGMDWRVKETSAILNGGDMHYRYKLYFPVKDQFQLVTFMPPVVEQPENAVEEKLMLVFLFGLFNGAALTNSQYMSMVGRLIEDYA